MLKDKKLPAQTQKDMNRVYELAEGNKKLLVRKLLHEGSPEGICGRLKRETPATKKIIEN